MPSSTDIEQLDAVACAQPHGTKLEDVKLGSSFEDPAAQLRDLRGAVTCSPHEIKEAIIWRRIAFCSWRETFWFCEDKRTIAQFDVRGKTFKIDFYNDFFPPAEVRRIAGDIFGLGAAKLGAMATPVGDSCSLERDHREPMFSGDNELEYTSLVCTTKIIGIKEQCGSGPCHYVEAYSFDKK